MLSKISCNLNLSLSDFSKDFRLAIDASGLGIGAVLIQTDDNDVFHPVSYFSKKLNKTQKNYSTIEKEALALILSVQHYSVYLECSATTVYTDHNPLTFIHKFKTHNAKLMRWALLLQPYDLTIIHIVGPNIQIKFSTCCSLVLLLLFDITFYTTFKAFFYYIFYSIYLFQL